MLVLLVLLMNAAILGIFACIPKVRIVFRTIYAVSFMLGKFAHYKMVTTWRTWTGADDTNGTSETAATIRKRAPLSLKVTLRLVREGRSKPTLKHELMTEFRLVRRFLSQPDIQEGVRAALIDRDQSPKWQPASLEEVTQEMVDACFAPLGDGELSLTDHWTLAD